MIELVKKNGNVELGKPSGGGHQHYNKLVIDKFKETAEGRVAYENELIRLLNDGAVIKDVFYTYDEDDKFVLRILFGDDSTVIQFIDFEVLGAYEKYVDDGTDNGLWGYSVDVGLNYYAPMERVAKTTDANDEARLYPNTYYEFGVLEDLAIKLVPGDDNKLNAYYFSFEATDNTILWLPEEIQWGNDNELVIEGGKRYEICIVNNVALWCASEAVS